MNVRNQVQLITYPDSLGGDLKTLRTVLETHLADVFPGGVHILPPFPSSGDRGFAPTTYFEIDSKFGSWEDLRAIGERFDVMVDLMVNHISRESAQFQDFLQKGRESEHAELFITLEKLWPDGIIVQDDIDKMFLRRSRPLSTFPIANKDIEETVWTTFGKTDPSEQIDLDVSSEKTMALLTEFLEYFKRNNVKYVRLDAVGYVIKRLGTSCFFVEPDIYHFLDQVKSIAASLDLVLLPEVHAHHSIQYKLAEYGCWIYDFILPYRILDTLVHKNSVELQRYLRKRPANQFTMLDCHDGVPVKPDMDGLIQTTEARKLVDVCLERGANLSLIVSNEHKDADGFDVHQIRCTFYSALNCDDDAYLTARAIQLFTPGIPQVYYVGLLAGENDLERVNETGEGREINRHNYTVKEIEQALGKPSVQRLLKLIRFRNEYEAFQGQFEVLACESDKLRLSWKTESKSCMLYTDLQTNVSMIIYTGENGELTHFLV